MDAELLLVAEEHMVDRLTADRLVLEDLLQMIADFEDVVVADDQERARVGFGMSFSVASRIVAHVPSVPASAAATLKPRSGSSSSRL